MTGSNGVESARGQSAELQSPSPPGRGLCTEFGDYWIVPDDTNVCYANVAGQQITETEFASAQSAWSAIQNGTGAIQITETDPNGTNAPGFRATVLGHLGKLMSQPVGRGLVIDLVNGSKTVTIGPATAGNIANATRTDPGGALIQSDGSAGAGSGTTIRIDPALTDTSISVFDKDGNEIAEPIFIALGHEMIHAEHNAAGTNQRDLAPADAAYGNKEEEQTISTGSRTENMLRAEHGVAGTRFGHGGKLNP